MIFSAVVVMLIFQQRHRIPWREGRGGRDGRRNVHGYDTKASASIWHCWNTLRPCLFETHLLHEVTESSTHEWRRHPVFIGYYWLLLMRKLIKTPPYLLCVIYYIYLDLLWWAMILLFIMCNFNTIILFSYTNTRLPRWYFQVSYSSTVTSDPPRLRIALWHGSIKYTSTNHITKINKKYIKCGVLIMTIILIRVKIVVVSFVFQ